MKKIKYFISLIIVFISMTLIVNCKQKDNNVSDKISNSLSNSSFESGENMKLYIKVNNNILIATLENNSSVDQLLEKLEKQDITICMQDYANFEKVGYLGFDLIRNDKNITTKAGDLILYQGNQFVIYYDTNSWNFTKLGHIDNINQEQLKQILGNGNVIVTLSLNANN